ncbi:MAG TPA: type II secretion system protein [Burkholderiales bacterium]|nr:type II secretion system protein [Burkholderiales bacterium]
MSATDGNRGQTPIKAPISNPSFFARRALTCPPKVQLRGVAGSKNKALTPIAEAGFTYLGVMILVMIMGMGLAAFGTIYSQTAQRDKETELLFVGEQFRQAIASYYKTGPGGQYPKKLEDLVEDKRFPMPVRHLRRIYADPITGSSDWGIVETPDKAGIMGVFSRSEEKPIKSGNFSPKQEFDDAENYTKWTFVYTPPTPQNQGTTAGSSQNGK